MKRQVLPILGCLITIVGVFSARADDSSEIFMALVMECRGTVLVELPGRKPEKIENCADGLAEAHQWITPGTRWRLEEGHATILYGTGATRSLSNGQEVFEPRKPTRKGGLLDSWQSARDALLAVFGRRTVDTVLKGDDGESSAHPRLVLRDEEYLASFVADGPVMREWKGILQWQGIPDFASPVLRAYAGGKRVFGPERLPEPRIDLADVVAAGAREVRLELLVVDSPYLPNDFNLSLPVESLLSLHGKPVRAVLVSHLRLADPGEFPCYDPRAEPWKPLLDAGDRFAAAAVAAHGGRWTRAREILGPCPDENVEIRMSGLEMVGTLPTRNH